MNTVSEETEAPNQQKPVGGWALGFSGFLRASGRRVLKAAASFRDHLSKHAAAYLWFLIAVVAVLMLNYVGAEQQPPPYVNEFVVWGVLIVLAISLVTREIKSSGDKIAILRLGYGFAILVSVAAIYLLIGNYNGFVTSRGTLEIDGHIYEKNIFGIVPGCDFAERGATRGNAGDGEAEDSRPAAMPDGAEYCGNLPPQWVINIGGLVLQCHVDGTCWRTQSAGAGGVDEGKRSEAVGEAAGSYDLLPCDSNDAEAGCMKSREDLVEEVARLEEELASAQRDVAGALRRTRIAELQIGTGLPAAKARQQIAEERELLKAAGSARHASEKALTLARKELERLDESRHIDNNVSPAMLIVGGVVVPVYFVALAIIGALVSMFRKLPEFQARNDPNYDDKFEDMIMAGQKPKGPISDSQIAELVIFQILQVLSAAAIAVLAYAYAEPANMATSIVLAFIAGYSSETILMGARAFVDSLIAQGPRGLRLNRIRERVEQEIGSKRIRSSVTLGGSVLRVGSRVRFRQDADQVIIGTIGTITAIGADDITVRVSGADEIYEVTKPDEFFEAAGDVEPPPISLSDPVG